MNDKALYRLSLGCFQNIPLDINKEFGIESDDGLWYIAGVDSPRFRSRFDAAFVSAHINNTRPTYNDLVAIANKSGIYVVGS